MLTYRVLVCVLAFAAASPAPAGAATISINRDDPDLPYGQFTATAGEINDVLLSLRSFSKPDPDPYVAGRRWPRLVIRDLGAPLIAGAGCVSVDEHTAECGESDGDYFMETRLLLGDGDDRLAVVPGDYLDGARLGEPHVDASGEAGNDVLATGNGERRPDTLSGGDGDDILTSNAPSMPGGIDTLAGGSGNDMLTGGSNGDTLIGGPGSDRMDGAAGDDELRDADGEVAASDTVEGGPGDDTVSYRGRTAPVVLDMFTTQFAEDAIGGVESAEGGTAADALAGTDAGEALTGGPGDDTLTGRGGDDLLAGGRGRDGLDCGAGKDFADIEDDDDFLAPSCERVGAYRRMNAYPEHVGRSSLAWLIPGARWDEIDEHATTDSGVILMTAGRHPRLVGRARLRIEWGELARAHIRLTAIARRLIARPGGIPVRVTVFSDQSVSRWRIQLGRESTSGPR